MINQAIMVIHNNNNIRNNNNYTLSNNNSILNNIINNLKMINLIKIFNNRELILIFPIKLDNKWEINLLKSNLNNFNNKGLKLLYKHNTILMLVEEIPIVDELIRKLKDRL
jgi:hypothetical protein